MATSTSRESAFVENAATKMVQQAVKYCIEKAFKLNGIPTGAAAPMNALYSEYAKRMTEVVSAAIRNETSWVDARDLRMNAERHEGTIERIISSSPIPELNRDRILLEDFLLLFAPTAVGLVREQRNSFLQHAKTLVDQLDGFIAGTESLIGASLNLVNILDSRSGNAQNRIEYSLESLFELGNPTAMREDICLAGSKMVISYKKLVEHRNHWAKISSMPPTMKQNVDEVKRKCIGNPFQPW